MNIAHLLPYTAFFPLKKHNGRYEWALRLAVLQAAEGHTVTIYAAPESSDKHSSIFWKSIAESQGDKDSNNRTLLKTAFSDTTHDIYHSHFDFLHYYEADATDKPVIFTQHWFPSENVAQAVTRNTKHNVWAVAPTHFMAAENARLRIPTIATIPHGIDLELFKPARNPKRERLLFVGRVTPTKGTLEAVKIATDAGLGLDIVGKVNEADKKYWEQILPFVDGKQIQYVGPKPRAEVAAYLAQALALVFPSQAMEAFGQVTIEAQACGTPVIISDIGASHELVKHRETGFVVHSHDEYVQAVADIPTLSGEACRKFAEQFDVNTMAEQYFDLYKKLIS